MRTRVHTRSKPAGGWIIQDQLQPENKTKGAVWCAKMSEKNLESWSKASLNDKCTISDQLLAWS